jgi:5-methylcytosine-specific restriction endonuclease McrA
MGRNTLSLRRRLWLWENARSQGLSKTCNICHKRITRFDDMELDHVRAYASGGKKLAMVHRVCNRMKSSGGLKEIQKKLGIEKPADQTRKIKLTQLLRSLKIKQLKGLCDEFGIKRPGSRDVGMFVPVWTAPSKSAYIRRIIKSNTDIEKIKKSIVK